MCHDLDSRPPILPISGGAGGDDIVLTAPDGNRFMAFMARAAQPKDAQILIYPDIRGLHQFYKELALRFSELGYPALAIDYFGRTAGISPRDDAFDYQPHVAQMQFPELLNDVTAALEHLNQESRAVRATFVVGFCRGGTLALLTAAENFNLAGVIGFYSGLSRPVAGARGSTLEQAAHIKVPVLDMFGGADQGIPASDREQLEAQLTKAGVEHEIVVYPGATHSFFDRKQAEFASESADAWKRVQAFIAKYKGKR